MPTGIRGHSMVILGFGQVILGGNRGGKSAINDYRKEIYYFTCYQHDCTISSLNQFLEVPRAYFVAIPIPDSTSGCISDSKLKIVLTSYR